MSNQVTGQVFRVYSKTWPGKFGKPGNTTYSVKLENDSMFYRTPRGKSAGSDGDPLAGIAEPGAIITFQVEPIDDKSAQIIAGTAKKVEQAPAQAPVAGALNASGSGSPAYNAGGRDASIQYQSSRKDAIALVDVLTRIGAVTLPAKAAAKLEALEALVDHYTSTFYTDIGSLGAIARANGTDEKGSPEATPAADGEE